MCPHMPFFLRKNIFSTRLAFCMLRTAKKAAKGTRACLRSSSSALATVIQLSTPRRGRFWRCLVSLCSGAVRCTQPTDPPQIVFYAQGYCPGLSDHRRMQRFSLLRGPYPALSLDEPAWGIPHLFPSGWVRMNQGTENRAVRVLGGTKGLAPGQGPGCRAGS